MNPRKPPPTQPKGLPWQPAAVAMLIGLALLMLGGTSHGAEPTGAHGTATAQATPPLPSIVPPLPPTSQPTPMPEPAKTPAPSATQGNPVVQQIRQAIQSGELKGSVRVTTGELSGTAHAAPVGAPSTVDKARAGAHGLPAKSRVATSGGHSAKGTAGKAMRDAHWSYAGPTGPESWASLNPDYATCAKGTRQSPIHIMEGETLVGPAEPLGFDYRPSGGSVVNNGHTIQVDVKGENTLTVRGSTYRLLQFHFHHPSEERINYKGFAMVAHLVHRNDAGQLAVVGVMLDPGETNPLIHKVWTHMPLDENDRVPLPEGLIDLNELLPADQRYYQFLGSLTTPPCSEGVLWMVLKGVQSLSRDELRLFSQQFPMNARPVQPLNGRPVREAQ